MEKIESVSTTSTSNVSENFNEFIIDDNSRSKFSFQLSARMRSNDSNPPLSLKFKYYRKNKKNNDEVIFQNKNDVKNGWIANLNLNEEQFDKFYNQLLLQIKAWEDSGKKIHWGYNTQKYINLDTVMNQQFLSFIKDKKNLPYLLKTKRFYDLTIIDNAIEKIKLGIQTKEKENYWQDLFTTNGWILTLLFPTPIVKIGEKCYVGHKTVFNTNGKNVDFMFSNILTGNVSLIELKIPSAAIMQDNEYGKRSNIYGITKDLSGAINQLLIYKDSLYKSWFNIKGSDSTVQLKNINLFNPKLVLIIGQLSNLNSDKIKNFDLFRKSLANFDIITYDELLKKVENIKTLLNYDENCVS